MDNNKKKKKTDIVTKMTIIGVLGLLVILVVILTIAFSSMKKKPDNKNKGNQDITVDNNVDNDGNRDVEYVRALGVIKEVDSENDQLTILNIENNESVTLKIDSAVDIKDEYGSLMTLVQFNVGDMIETKYDKKEKRPDFIHKTAKTWKRSKINEVVVDKEKKTITVGNDIYNYTDDLVTIFNGNSFGMDDLAPEDEVTLMGYKDNVWTIIMEKGHGYISLNNHSNFIGGILEIGTNKTVNIEENTLVAVPVGVHDILVTNDQLTYETEVMVEKDQRVTIDVKDATPRKGMVQFSVAQKDISFTINGETYSDFSKPISLDYGKYTIKIVKDGFVDWENELVVNKPFATFEIDLEKKPTYIHVDSPEGADIYIDGNFIGVLPITTPIEPGEHTITLRRDGYFSKMYEIVVKDNGEDSYQTFPELEKLNTESDNPIVVPNDDFDNDETDDVRIEELPSFDDNEEDD
ncbi:hypothetical protein SH1V18_10330 [Vallitalea longa]|uniref:PEGA domain-containing protein n=1 Tax=Vallitalea longa TaxID=2936439 RepID=A0A9W5YA04_9FIRM|nr:PEGA domain-containing protein [Vallitalea longa]GKX28553.1 hypothetical protein SH1V18_10330 [Vallitalea longa]